MWLPRQAAACAALGCVLSVQAPFAESRAQDNRFETVRTLACTFAVASRGAWSQDGPEAAIEASTLAFRFESINTDEASAEVLGRFGASPVVAQAAGDYLHFVQVLAEGPLYSTTVFNRETPGGRLLAVHSRHEHRDTALIGFTSSPEQYYGDCEVR
jgi:hypothetical protein